MMNVIVNDKPYQLENPTSLVELIKELHLPEKGTAIAVNEQVIPKTSWNNYQVVDKDKVLVITATQGG